MFVIHYCGLPTERSCQYCFVSIYSGKITAYKLTTNWEGGPSIIISCFGTLLFVYYLDVFSKIWLQCIICNSTCKMLGLLQWCQPATCTGPGLEVSIQSPEKEVKGNVVVSVIVKEPEPNVISWLPTSQLKAWRVRVVTCNSYFELSGSSSFAIAWIGWLRTDLIDCQSSCNWNCCISDSTSKMLPCCQRYQLLPVN